MTTGSRRAACGVASDTPMRTRCTRARIPQDRCLLERLVGHAFEQLLSRPNGLQMQQFGGEMWREDRKINCMADDDDSRN